LTVIQSAPEIEQTIRADFILIIFNAIDAAALNGSSISR